MTICKIFENKSGVAVTRWVYNQRRLLSANTEFAGQTIDYTLVGRLAERRNAPGFRILYQYNNPGRLIFQRYPYHSTKLLRYQYDRLGNPTRV